MFELFGNRDVVRVVAAVRMIVGRANNAAGVCDARARERRRVMRESSEALQTTRISSLREDKLCPDTLYKILISHTSNKKHSEIPRN